MSAPQEDHTRKSDPRTLLFGPEDVAASIDMPGVVEAAACAILSTVTPVRDPIVRRAWLRPGTHVNAIGADAEGKQELESAVVEEARVVIDDWEQCSHSGEINVPVSEGRIGREDIHGTLGAIVAGELEGRSGEEITVFDSTGLAIQDVATARLVYETGRERGRGT